MTDIGTGEKIRERRLNDNYTLEKLAELVGVDALTIDKWESGLERPDAEQLRKLGEVFGCGYERLLPEPEEQQEPEPDWGVEWTSRRHLRGMPLVHINIGFMSRAEGIIAVGFIAKGLVSVGILSMGVISAGLLSLGLLTAGVISIGVFAATFLGLSLFHIFLPWIETVWGFLTAGSRINPRG